MYVAPGSQYGNAREALAHMVHELHNPQRDTYNETLDFTYARLPALLDMLRDPIYQHGLMLNQELKIGTNGLPFDMVTTFHHIPSATEVSFALPAYIKEDKRLDDCQRVGASYTYFRRYGLRQALNITDGDDDADQAEAKRERKGKKAGRGRTAQPDALHDELMQCLPDGTAPGWEEAERRAVAMGATPYTPEQIEAAKDQKREFAKLTPEEVAVINEACDGLAGDFREITPIYNKYEAVLAARIEAREVFILDEEDLRRGYHRCWLQASQEFSGVPVSPLCDEDDIDEAPALPEPLAKLDNLSAEEQARISEKRDARLAGLCDGSIPNTSGDPSVDAELDAVHDRVKGEAVHSLPTDLQSDALSEPAVIIPESELPY
ncbi:ERF superfamily protein [compost metagenome]